MPVVSSSRGQRSQRLALVIASALAGCVVGGCVLDRMGAGTGTAAGGSTAGGGSGGMVSSGGGTESGGGTPAGGHGGTGGAGGTGAGGVGGVVDNPICSDGLVEGSETCDDGNAYDDDGCVDCQIAPGYTCSGEPSACALILPHIVAAGPDLGVAIFDGAGIGAYDGDLATMACVELVVADEGFHDIQWVEVAVAIDHAYLGDLVLKLESPAGTVTTLMSRPGVDESVDAYYEPNGESSNLVASHPIRFSDTASNDAEYMGNTIPDWDAACRDDNRCAYAPNSGAGPGLAMADFAGEDPVGTWRLCAADGDDGDAGTVQAVELTLLAW
jgi:cysteine-rich repeat protein